MTSPNLGFPELEIGMWEKGKELSFNELVSMLDTLLNGIAGDADLVAIAALTGAGILVRTGVDTWVLRTTVAPAAGLTITNPDGVAGNPTFALADDLAALEGLSSTGIAVRTATSVWAQRTLTGTASKITVTNGNGVAGNPTFTIPDGVALVTPGITGAWTASGGHIIFAYDAGATPTYSQGQLELNSGGTNPVVLGFHRPGFTAAALVHDSTTGELEIHAGTFGTLGSLRCASVGDASGTFTINGSDVRIGDNNPKIIGDSTGSTNTSYLQFMESNGSTRRGWVGDGSTDAHIRLASDVAGSNLVFHSQAGDRCQIGALSFAPMTDGGFDLGNSSLFWNEAYIQNVVFPATQVASAGANTLDDYEEGTWTPTVTFATPGDLSVAYSTRVGRYRKVGSFVYVQAVVATTTFTHTTASGVFQITGAPFAGVAGDSGLGAFAMSGWTDGSGRAAHACRLASSTTIDTITTGSGLAVSQLTVATVPSGGTLGIRLGLSYIAT